MYLVCISYVSYHCVYMLLGHISKITHLPPCFPQRYVPKAYCIDATICSYILYHTVQIQYNVVFICRQSLTADHSNNTSSAPRQACHLSHIYSRPGLEASTMPGIKLQRDDHAALLLKGLTEVLSGNPSMADVTLACEGGTVKGHRAVLAACSPYLMELLAVSIIPIPSAKSVQSLQEPIKLGWSCPTIFGQSGTIRLSKPQDRLDFLNCPNSLDSGQPKHV